VKKRPISRFTVDKLSEKSRAELDARIAKSLSSVEGSPSFIDGLIKRFSGWITSVDSVEKKVLSSKEKFQDDDVSQLDELQVTVNQTLRLINDINTLSAIENGAFAAQWHSNWRQLNYEYRESHKRLDEAIFLIRNSWADKAGYINAGYQYIDEIEEPGNAPGCRCRFKFIYRVSQLPEKMISKKGKEAIKSKIIF